MQTFLVTTGVYAEIAFWWLIYTQIEIEDKIITKQPTQTL